MTSAPWKTAHPRFEVASNCAHCCLTWRLAILTKDPRSPVEIMQHDEICERLNLNTSEHRISLSVECRNV